MPPALNLPLTLGIAFLAGFLCEIINLPVPYLLGSLAGVWLAGLVCKPIRQRLEIPRWLLTLVILGLGVLIGAIFTAEVVAKATRLSLTAIALAIATVLATAAGFWHLTRRGYENRLALLCCLPGGQAEAVAMSRDLGRRSYVVALCHLARITIVFCATPLVLAAVYGRRVLDEATAAVAATPGVLDLSPLVHLQFIVIAAVGFAVAKLLRLPIPHLLGPMLVSGIAHYFGIVTIPRIAEFMLLAQLVIGGSVGARLARVPAPELADCARDALLNALLIIFVYAVCAFAIFFVGAHSMPDLLLAFIPGGLFEVTLLTLLFGFDLAFVTFHHVFRVLLIYLSLPFIMARVN